MNDYIKKPHGLMFHHFHNINHEKSQGSISSDQLESIISYYKNNYNLLNASEWQKRALQGNLKNKDTCITFDDSLLCQYQVALPILEQHNLTAFWFIYSSVISGGIEMLEIYRKFRSNYYDNMDDFYEDFNDEIQNSTYSLLVEQSLKKYNPETYLDKFPFYTPGDKKFRFLRDVSLGMNRYNNIMKSLMTKYKIDILDLSHDLWINEKQLENLNKNGHIIGLHSHTHPTRIAELSYDNQLKEYGMNYNFIKRITKSMPISMSHPANSYNKNTLNVLNHLGIKIGFRSNMEPNFNSNFEYPREDHSNILKLIS